MKEKIFEEYNAINLGNCDTCIECQKSNMPELKKPVSIWFIGEKFTQTDDNILFVGKTARSVGKDLGPLINESFIDATNFGKRALKENPWPYWSYTREIIKNYYGTYAKGICNIALTNMMKCNNGSTQDTTSLGTKHNCIKKLGIIWREIELLHPNKIIFYTSKSYDDFIEKWSPSNAKGFKDITNKEHHIKVGKKHTYWWHRDYFDENGQKTLSFLRLSHPERLKKESYVEKVVNWL